MSKYVQYYGVDTPPSEQVKLNAGPVSVLFEPELGFLRYIKLGDREILRGVYVAVRDHNWGTVAPKVDNVNVESSDDGFVLTFDVACVVRDIDFFWHGRITGDVNGTVVYKMDGEARSTFMRNRIGFCVLHAPSECAGDPCVIEKADGGKQEGHFPSDISPHQPFMDMKAITHEVMPGVSARVAFEGDVFEMEDQRNWTDASYKTYCTPLGLPFPVEVKKGEKIQQSVTISLEGDVSGVKGRDGADAITFQATGNAAVLLPEIGVGLASHGQVLSDVELSRLRVLNLAHLRVDLRLSSEGWRGALDRAIQEATALDLKLEIALYVSDNAQAELNALGEALSETTPNVVRWFIFHEGEKSTSAGWVTLAREVLKKYDTHPPLGGGANAYFTELNRNRPPVHDIECVTYSLNPQVHAFDNASMVETLEAQSWTVNSARSFVDNLPISVSPVTLKPRFNPNATGAAPEGEPGVLPLSVDPRQMSLFGAGWTLGSLKYLSEAGVRSVTYYETSGWRGVQETEMGSREPDLFQSTPASVFPLFHTMAYFGGVKGGEIIPSASSNTLRVDGAILRKGKWVRFLITNLTAEEQKVRVSYAGLNGTVRAEIMDEAFFETATESPERFRLRKTEEQGVKIVEVTNETFELTLAPFALVCAKAAV
ncbi:MAG: hypothetical protein HN521_21460 [Candidatus Latescibacteria bacterium]|nr:hypothetical protein [Candidatus Latescibacterota bacterium]